MTISRSQTGKTVSLKPPAHLQHRVTLSSSPLGKKENKRKPLLPATKKNFKKYKKHGIKTPLLTASSIFKSIPDAK